MKITLCYIFLSVVISKSLAQMTDDNTSNYYNNSSSLTTEGYKFVNTSHNDTIFFYNTDHSLFKTLIAPMMNLPTNYPHAQIPPTNYFYISDKLFDSDADIEYLAYYKGVIDLGSFQYHDTLMLVLVDETNGIIQTLDSFGHNVSDFGLSLDGYSAELYSDGSSFSKIKIAGGSISLTPLHYKYYSLLGLPACNSCSSINGFKTIASEEQGKLYPNPTNSDVTIEFNNTGLSKSYNVAVYNSNGSIVSKYYMEGNKSSINIKTNTFSNGVYVCIITDLYGSHISTNKFIINK